MSGKQGKGQGPTPSIAGTSVNDFLIGTAGVDIIDGRAGVDTMQGGGGNDTYVVDNAGDKVFEAAGERTDTVAATIAIDLSQAAFANVENVTLLGTGAINATGSAADNLLNGNGGANKLDGGAGADTMQGGAGNDTYVVDNAGDVVSEAANGGTDTLLSSGSYSLADNVESLTLTRSANIHAPRQRLR